ncbi:MAG: HAD-IA family hydrolase [Acidobacteriaceae bacterium]|nr:HAD-IA family hydrolase [Acidobacteriaceae bacterium]
MLIIFDLDGTLIDSSKDLAISMNATRAHMGMPPLDPNLIFSYVGNGVAALVQRALGDSASEPMLQEAVAYFLKFYRAHALEHTQLYPGIRELLEQLSSARHKLAVLTNKPARISYDIVKALAFADRFIRVYGGDSFAAKKPDPIGVATLIGDAGARHEDTLLVGDSAVDVEAARNAGVRCCGVLWGFQPEGLRAKNPDIMINQPAELLNYIHQS